MLLYVTLGTPGLETILYIKVAIGNMNSFASRKHLISDKCGAMSALQRFEHIRHIVGGKTTIRNLKL
jgi:hypothetical protein